MTKKTLFIQIAKSEFLTIFEIHIAMALTMRKNYSEMLSMYGKTLAPTLNRLKNKNVALKNKRGHWVLNEDPDQWHDFDIPPKQEELTKAKSKSKATNQDRERQAALEMMADLEYKLNELKEKIA